MGRLAPVGEHGRILVPYQCRGLSLGGIEGASPGFLDVAGLNTFRCTAPFDWSLCSSMSKVSLWEDL